MEETNLYLALRAEKIARNDARLKELGLLRPTTCAVRVSNDRRPKTGNAKEVTPSVKKASLPLRRSSRHCSRPSTYTEPPEPKRRKSADCGRGGERKESITAVTPEPEVVKTFPAHSARAMDIHVENLVLGGMLGNTMERTGKAFVMEETARRSGLDVNNISFNKYSGVQEWKNDALFLWVNLGNMGDVVNDFLDGGRQVRCQDSLLCFCLDLQHRVPYPLNTYTVSSRLQITWFGGSRMHEETKVIKRLLRVGKATTSGANASSDGLVLWCRRFDVNKKSFTPYVCLGRLSYHSHEVGSRPLKFVWNLMDYDRLVNHQEENVRSSFQEFVES